ncbi:MAG: chloride channel protein, partial [Gammaproteobacteria bacterium]
ELLILAGLGLFIGALAVVFISVTERVSCQSLSWRPLFGFALAGLLTGLLGQWYPQVLGISYDTLDAILDHSFAADFLLGLLLAKLLATAVSIGLRVPGGLIGPSLVIGGAAGALCGVLAPGLFGFETSSVTLYAAVGMIAMMGALLQAPLAALCALLELTADPNVILPGMAVVVTADMMVRQLLGRGSVFEHLRRLSDPDRS